MPQRPADTRQYGDDGLFQRLVRRLRDLLIMGLVGPAAGALAIVAIHFAMTLQQPRPDLAAESARRAEAERALAILEDRYPGTAAPSAGPVAPPPQMPTLTAADFKDSEPTPDARHMADWVVARHDNGRMSFVVLDKRDARLYVFKPNGELVGDTPVLLGSAHGDETFPGIGDVPIAQVKPYQRTTAAGRFVTRPGLDADHTDVVWLDYDAALAMHRVINKVKAEHRLQHLANPNPKARRISWGCINIPIPFFDAYISPVFGKRPGVTYVIPERKTFAEVFEQGAPTQSVATLESSTLAPKDVAQR
ncbi:hypothetical protein [Scleromatobacter humisilvae]|uniref:YkuD domain-containing protein n=1 Tax=Scleromatobacter humisilvae TaxID=2897159 RepID=A0A9X1YH02_9BURK|nr:hypothetical protein [Scleromatobacter humisilvae]MCK9686144.1 hypothetical protein [Scleromatobacter humisilvae]